MPDTPGHVAYAAYYERLYQHPALVTLPRLAWDTLHEEEQRAWEAAAQAAIAAWWQAHEAVICGEGAGEETPGA